MFLREIKTLGVADTGIEDCRFYVSDLHAGNGSRSDDFAPRSALFAEFARSVGWANIRFVGDVLEGWQSSLRPIADAHPVLLANIGRGVHGNHDRAINPLPSLYREGNVVCAHGHQADPWNSRYRLVGKLVTVVAGAFERLGWKDADNPWTWRTPAELKGEKYSDYCDRHMARWIEKMLRKHEPTVFLYGHTHRAYLAPLPDGRAVANTGAWASDVFPCTAIRVERRRVTQLEIEP